MWSSTPNYTKLKTNLKLAQNRLKLLEKKKSEIAQKARKEIAEYLAAGKIERARIRVEHIIREDYLVEAMEVVEVYCDLILARFGLITQMKELDEGIAEAVSSIVWVCPRMQSDIGELKVIADIFIQKYGAQFAEKARTATEDHHVSEKLMHKLQLQAPPKLLVEKYLIEIAKNYNIEYEPDPQIINNEPEGNDHYLIDLSDRNNLSGEKSTAPPHIGFVAYPTVPPLPQMPNTKPFNYPPYGGNGGASTSIATPFAYNIPPKKMPQHTVKDGIDLNKKFIEEELYNELYSSSAQAVSDNADDIDAETSHHDESNLHANDSPPPPYSSINPVNLQHASKPKPQPRLKLSSGISEASQDNSTMDISQLPNVPLDLPDGSNQNEDKTGNDDIDFDDLTRRFESLKKRK